MKMTEQIALDNLTEKSVSIKIQNVIKLDDILQPVGSPKRQSYINSQTGRKELLESVQDPYLSSILAVWGDSPQLEDFNVTEDNPSLSTSSKE